ncbi:lipase family protein [Streptomyces sp. TRM 70351]|uniref:lipase family protein n=1 Tax=Streptomyces sp. TRM 70351 TaxID=3116552 RepID=UPI002E7BD067|nr:lipase family protein [Streptomyces sp. TRM 70351]MEE1927061.1 lipase family protein [Streptomyces sp. TRM 70351]
MRCTTTRLLSTAAALALLAPAGQALAAPAAPAVPAPGQAPGATAAGPVEDDFYVPPSPLPAGEPGDVIRARPAKAGPPAAQRLADAWQVMYRSTDALGEPAAVTGTVLVPRGQDPAAMPVVGLGPGTHGPAFRCAPSRMIDGSMFYEQPVLNAMLERGWAVAVTDYGGYQPATRTTYVVGHAMGPALIDAVRAAQRLPGAGLSEGAKVAFRGYSQGGGAAMWAGQLQPEYAPELDLVGVVGGGVPADLIQVALPLEGRQGFGLLAYSLIGLDNAYPELELDSYLNDTGRTVFADMEREDCTVELLLDYAGDRSSTYLSKSPFLEPEWLARVQENKLGGTPIEVPVHQYHATADELVAYRQAAALRDAYCAQGMDLTWSEYGTDHITAVHRGSATGTAFLADRFAGRPAASGC